MVGRNSIDAKIIVVGGTGVGKTSLACCFQSGKFVDNPSTIGANLFTRTVEVPGTSYRVHMQIWDTAGQERFRAVSKIYYRGVSAAIFCYDITSLESYDEHEYWLRDIRNYASDNVLIHVVGTKLDLVGDDDENRAVPYSQCVEDVTSFFTHQEKPSIDVVPAKSRPGHRASTSVADVFNLDLLHSPTFNHLPVNAVNGVPRPRPVSMFNPSTTCDDRSEYAYRCHEVSSRTNHGVREVFDRIARCLVEQHIAESRRREAPPPAPASLPPVRAEKRNTWLGFRGSDSDRQNSVGLDDYQKGRNSSNNSCC